MPARNVHEKLQIAAPPVTTVVPKRRPGRPIGSKNKRPKQDQPTPTLVVLATQVSPPSTSGTASGTLLDVAPNEEVFIHLNSLTAPAYSLDRSTVQIDEEFCCYIAALLSTRDHDPISIEEARKSTDWHEWRAAINAKLESMRKRRVFGVVQETPSGFNPVGYKWVFVKKRNDKGEEIYMKVPEGLGGFGTPTSKFAFQAPSVRIYRSIYGLKQAGRIWYQRLSDFFVKHGFVHNPLCPCIFIRSHKGEFVIIAVYVDDLNFIGMKNAISDAIRLLKSEFEIKDLWRTSFCLGLQLAYVSGGVLLHQSTYIQKILKQFSMDKAVRTPMVVRTLDMSRDVVVT
ncbi:hypothetical protein R1sor_018975 [Riccia sorocarpa]|uniref:Reverse transcriptase Ty1/copia-type domain-containing protein n=1 Tax=Riccia sorocarpa TaxID=122646 RepID=A0ABD3IBB6_9MARC